MAGPESGVLKHPSLAKEGWLRPSKKCREASLAGASGLVCLGHRLSVVEQPPRPRLKRKGTILSMARPPLLGQGGVFLCLRLVMVDDKPIRKSKPRRLSSPLHLHV